MSHTQVQWARGTSAQVAAYTGPAAEVVVDTDDYSLSVQDGATAGGRLRLTPGILPPQGRLTLTSGAPVMASDVAGAGTLYYTPYIGQWLPIYNGTFWQQLSFAETPLTLDSNPANSGYQASGSLYDIFAYNNAGTLALGTGPAWSSTTSRGSGAGTTQIALQNGIWTNAVSIALHTGIGTSVTVAANEATCLGTLYATANGQTTMQFAPAAAAGGTGNVLGLYNAYNRERTISTNTDSTASWTYGTAAWRAADNSTNNRVTWVDGLNQSAVEASYATSISAGSTTTGYVGVAFNGTAPTRDASWGGTPIPVPALASDTHKGAGLNYAQAVEFSNGGTSTFTGSNSEFLRVALGM